MSISLDDDALAVFRSLVLHVATGSPLTEAERMAVSTIASQLGAERHLAPSPLVLDACDPSKLTIECNAEAEFSLMQIGTAVWLISHIIRMSGNVDRKRRRSARELVEYFETRKQALGLDPERPILFQYLKYVPHLRAIERSAFLGGAWLPALFLRTAPDLDSLVLDKIYQSPQQRLTLYKLCYWFAAASGRRNASVIDLLGRIRCELVLDSDARCIGISDAIAKVTGTVSPALQDPDRTRPLAALLASRVVAGTLDVAVPKTNSLNDMAADHIVAMIPESDRLPALAIIFDIAARETQLSPAALGSIARIIDSIDPSEGELTGILLRHELDSGKRIQLPRSYSIDYAKMHAKSRNAAQRRSA